jgi:hypothetical protein
LHALCHARNGTILARDPRMPRKMHLAFDGSHAVTRYRN